MTRKTIIAGNWKMNKTESETVHFIEELSPLVSSSQVSIYLAVPFTSIHVAKKSSEKTNIIIGAQNMNDVSKGAFTGEIAGIMLTSAGAEFVILGHSERRHIFKENDEFINKKVLRALKDGLQPILCIGEKEEERENNQTESVLERQLTLGLKGVAKEDIETIIIAYEPVWAIGTGKSATPEMAQEAHHFIRHFIGKLYTKKEAEKIPLLYGGSVKPDNIQDLIDQNDIDGALIGGASLETKSFSEIINQC